MHYTAQQYESNYPAGFEESYWNRARNRLLQRVLRRISAARILDVGCGPGAVVSYLHRQGYHCRGVDLGQPRPLASAAGLLTLSTAAAALPATERHAFDTLMLLDVIEHVASPVSLLGELREAFPQARHLVLTVPARPELWSNYDEHYGHHRRYTCRRLLDEVASAVPGTEVLVMRYFFRALYPPALAARVLLGGRGATIHSPRQLWLHELTARVVATCDACLPPFVYGTSLLGVFALPTRVDRC